MKIVKAEIFKQFPELIFGFSTKIGLNRGAPYYFNMSHTVGDNPEIVNENRIAFFKALGLMENEVALQRQIHSDNITYVDHGGIYPDSDGLITNKRNLGLAVSSADCAAVFIYDNEEKVICGIHSGWRGTEKRIIARAVEELKNSYNCNVNNMFVYIAPSISQKNYEVGGEVADKFNKEFLLYKNNKIYLDVSGANYNMLLQSGIPDKNIERSLLCSFEEEDLHSYRRDGIHSGRALGVIALK